jgi:ABC-2 type transport system ATP-binding protein
MENVFQEVVAEAKHRGTSVLLSSHIMAEVETLADRLSIIRDGAVVQSGTLADLRGRARTTIRATLERSPERRDLVLFHDVHVDGAAFSATVDSARVGEAVAALGPSGIASLTVAPPSLESLFLRLYGEQPVEAAEASR